MSRPIRLLILLCVIFTTYRIISKLSERYVRLRAESDLARIILMNKYAPNPKYTIKND